MNGGTKRCSWKEKHDYVRQSKFTIAGDSVHYPGFVTEKIVDPFIYHSIPIYYGSTKIEEDFNINSFVLLKNESNLQDVIEQVILLDNHDDAYLEMLMQQPLVSDGYLKDKYACLENFLVNIFTQDINDAGRRIKHFCATNHESYLKNYMKIYNKTPKFIRTIKEQIKK